MWGPGVKCVIQPGGKHLYLRNQTTSRRARSGQEQPGGSSVSLALAASRWPFPELPLGFHLSWQLLCISEHIAKHSQLWVLRLGGQQKQTESVPRGPCA